MSAQPEDPQAETQRPALSPGGSDLQLQGARPSSLSSETRSGPEDVASRLRLLLRATEPWVELLRTEPALHGTMAGARVRCCRIEKDAAAGDSETQFLK